MSDGKTACSPSITLQRKRQGRRRNAYVSRATPLSRSRGSRGVQEPNPGRPEEDGGHASLGRVPRVRNRGLRETPRDTPPNTGPPARADSGGCAGFCCSFERINRHEKRTKSSESEEHTSKLQSPF